MKLWINFEEKDIKQRKEGWSEGDDWESQLIFKETQDSENCNIIFDQFEDVRLSFNNGYLTMTKNEFGNLFR